MHSEVAPGKHSGEEAEEKEFDSRSLQEKNSNRLHNYVITRARRNDELELTSQFEYMLRKACLSMANDGCQLPAWTGQAFAYLPHHPRGAGLASQSYAQQRPQGDMNTFWLCA